MPEIAVADHSEGLGEHDAMWSELQALPPRQRAAIVLRYYEDLTERETADAMGCTVGTVKEPGLRRTREASGPIRDGRCPPDDDRGGGFTMTDRPRDMMNARAAAAPGPNIDIQGVVRNGQRRVWRHRAAAGTAACAVVAAAATIVPAISLENDSAEPGIAESAGFAIRTVTYAQGSTIHYGDEIIDVSPHDPTSFEQTDDGFVFTTEAGQVYFTDGGTPEVIGDGGWELRADDSGSYVGWWSPDGDEEAVFYDTSRRVEVLRTPLGRAGCFDHDTRRIAVDDGVAYTCRADRVTAWNLATQRDEWSTSRPDAVLTDAADGCLAWNDGDGTIVSRDPDADQPRLGGVWTGQRSPSADYIAARRDRPASWGGIIVDRETGDDVTPRGLDRDHFAVGQWLGDDTFDAVSDATPNSYVDERYRLSTCSISAGTCTDVTTVDGSRDRPLFPTGKVDESFW